MALDIKKTVILMIQIQQTVFYIAPLDNFWHLPCIFSGEQYKQRQGTVSLFYPKKVNKLSTLAHEATLVSQSSLFGLTGEKVQGHFHGCTSDPTINQYE